ncbi:MAG: MFS transporter, partial [Microbacteriaceae bacterium]
MHSWLAIQSVFVHSAWAGIKLLIGYRALAEGAEPFELGVVIAALSAPTLLVAVPIGIFADRVRGRVVIILGCVISVLATVLLLTSSGMLLLMLCSMLFGLGHMMYVVGQQHVVASNANNSRSDRDFGHLLATASLEQLLGPLIIAAVVSGLGSQSSVERGSTDIGFLLTGVVVLVSIPMTFWFQSGSKTVRTAESLAKLLPFSLLKTEGLWRSLLVSGVVIASMDLLYIYLPSWGEQRGIGIGMV